MKLKEYLTKFNIRVEELAIRADVSSASLWHYFSGRRTPSQPTAERLERETGGRVTVKELRGKDDRVA